VSETSVAISGASTKENVDYPIFRDSKMVQIKAQLEGKGHSLGESCNAELGHF